MTPSSNTVRRFRYAISGALLVVAFEVAGQAASAPFVELGVETGFRVDQPVVSARLAGDSGHELVLSGEDEANRRWLAIYRLQSRSSPTLSRLLALEAPPELLYFDVGRIGERDGLFFLAPGRIVRYDLAARDLVEVVRIQSIYRRPREGALEQLDFLRDLNDDGLDDLVVPDLEGLRARLQQADGELGEELVLPGSTTMELRGATARYQGLPMHVADMNFDDRVDLIVRRDRVYLVYLQDGQARFAREPALVPITLDLPTEAKLRELTDASGGVDQSKLTFERITWVGDLDGDGLLDVITDATYSKGLFDKKNELRVHLGRRESDRLVYVAAEDSALSAEGMQFDVRLHDINGDGRLDLMIPSAKLSFGKVIGALFSGSVSLDLLFYRMEENGRYPDVANYRTRAKVRFSIRSGQVDIPAVEVDDFDGDGFKDLLFQRGRDRLTLFRGEDTDELFSRRGEDIEVALPRNGELVDGGDLNADGKSDLVIRYNAADGEKHRRTIRLLLAR